MNPIQQFLNENEMSVSELARRVDMVVPHVWRMVNGKSDLSDAFKWRFQNAFGPEAAAEVFGRDNSAAKPTKLPARSGITPS